MKIFVVSDDLNITAYASAAQAKQNSEPGSIAFKSEAELQKATEKWNAARLVDLRNSIPGLERVGKAAFKSKTVAYKAIWKAIQGLTTEAEPEPTRREPVEIDAKPSERQVKADNEVVKLEGANPYKEGSVAATIFAMFAKDGGATVQSVINATGWKRHSIRGFLWHHYRRAA